MKITKKEFDVNLFVLFLALMIVAVTMTYIIGDYTNKAKIRTLTIRYEYEISNITTRTEKFFDNYSKALTYIDVARSDLKNALYHFDLAQYQLNEGDYRNISSSCDAALYYYNSSNHVFTKSLAFIVNSQSHTPQAYEELLTYYLNYTSAGINLTIAGKKMVSALSSAAEYYSQGKTTKGDDSLALLNTLKEEYDDYQSLFEQSLLAIKDFYGIRE
ncbi:MAG TPA: hypothetical protein ENI45_01970 [Thermoplasmatales archaeon]|nr:hypothetical protein [Thermoplasmatales archaeon]